MSAYGQKWFRDLIVFTESGISSLQFLVFPPFRLTDFVQPKFGGTSSYRKLALRMWTRLSKARGSEGDSLAIGWVCGINQA